MLKYVAGIDEAGRGCIFGDLFMAIVVVEANKLNKLSKLGVKDSKQLSADKRIELFDKIANCENGVVYASYVCQPPSVIDTVNLNKLEMMMCLELIKSVDKMDSIEFIVDDFTNGQWKKMGLPEHVKFEIKADENNPAVSAASIIAKVCRDTALAKLLANNGAPECSGYPSDPKTITYLKDYYKANKSFPSFARKSWTTCKDIEKKYAKV